MEPKKILGWIFLIFGLLLIFYVIFNSYQIFTGKVLPPNLFKEKEEKSPITLQKPLSPEEKAEQIAREEFQKQLQKMLPAEKVSQLLNLISWSILAGILIFAGSQISNLGIKLIKNRID